jgi:hypothetical protein
VTEITTAGRLRVTLDSGVQVEAPDVAVAITRTLCRTGYPTVTIDQVREQLALPADDRDEAGQVAFAVLEDSGLLYEL